MNERRLQFRVGLLVLVSISIGTAMAIRFGDLHKHLEEQFPVVVQLPSAEGLYPSAPVTMYGIKIGDVADIQLNEKRGGVDVIVGVKQGTRIRKDSKAIVVRTLLGETSLEFLSGASPEFLAPGTRISGQAATDPLAMVQRLEARTLQTLDAFAATSNDWRLVAKNLNGLMDSNRGDLRLIVERAAESLQEFTATMHNANTMIGEANKIVSNPAAQQALQQTLTSLPKMVEETRLTIAATRHAVENANRNLANLSQLTEPVGQKGPQIVERLDNSLASLESLLGELNALARVVNQGDGTLQRFASDPSLYENMDRSAQSMAVILRNAEPLIRDLKEFSDKIARNPEILGIGGALRPSPGHRDMELLTPAKTPAAATTTQKSGLFRGQN
ncbi:MlaD family protein [Planctellipticum variicoloris]|uniref:MlaD family protein n=1 Tax=Planctellipticum variicoloris TaxID=3064265 RepID=UPI0030140CF7|nr:MlaD family protein [Planctomycetaceae bacterium SH412]